MEQISRLNKLYTKLKPKNNILLLNKRPAINPIRLNGLVYSVMEKIRIFAN